MFKNIIFVTNNQSNNHWYWLYSVYVSISAKDWFQQANIYCFPFTCTGFNVLISLVFVLSLHSYMCFPFRHIVLYAEKTSKRTESVSESVTPLIRERWRRTAANISVVNESLVWWGKKSCTVVRLTLHQDYAFNETDFGAF